ncbi:MAG: MFS transporter [Halioglobus sp.]
MLTSSQGNTGTGSHRSAFASPEFRRYFPAAIFSTLGSWILRFLLGWSAWDLTESATWVGIVAGLLLAPALVLSPVFGIVSDRINPRNGLLITLGLHAALAGIAGLAVVSGLLALPVLLALSVALGIASSAQTPVRLALIPSLVPRISLPSAIGYSAITFNTSRILGPALGAALIQWSSPAAAYFCAAGLMAFSLLFLLGVTGRKRNDAKAAKSGFFDQLRDGFRYTRAHPSIRLIFSFTLINALLGRTVMELLPALSGVLLHGDSATLATLTAAAGAGSILGGAVVSRQGSEESRLVSLMIACLAAAAFLVAALGWSTQLISFACLIGLLSTATTIIGTSSQALAQLQVDDEYRGRVLSLWTMLAMGAPALGAMSMGVLADQFAFPLVLPAFALMALIALVYLNRHRVRAP